LVLDPIKLDSKPFHFQLDLRIFCTLLYQAVLQETKDDFERSVKTMKEAVAAARAGSSTAIKQVASFGFNEDCRFLNGFRVDWGPGILFQRLVCQAYLVSQENWVQLVECGQYLGAMEQFKTSIKGKGKQTLPSRDGP